MKPLSRQEQPTIIRSRFTWLAYLMLGYYAYMQATLGPSIPFLRIELSLNYTVAGLHSSAFAAGMIIAGTSGDIVSRLVGRKPLFWIGGAGMVTGGLLLTAGQSALITVSSAFIMGFIGTYLLAMIQALLSDEFSGQRAVALTESNLLASVFAMCAPLIIGFSTGIGLSWRMALLIGSLFWIIAFVAGRSIVLPVSQQESDDGVRKGAKLPPIYWLYWFIVFIGVAVEWCMIFWLADFLVAVSNIAPDIASSMVSLLLAAMIVGRFFGSRLTRYIPTLPLLIATSILILIGFPVFWLSRNLIGHGIGLIIIGAGIANLFPLGLSAASDAGSNNVDRASSRISQAAGFAILIAPQTLGTLADQVGIFRAYLVLPVLALILIIMISFAWYLNRSKE